MMSTKTNFTWAAGEACQRKSSSSSAVCSAQYPVLTRPLKFRIPQPEVIPSCYPRRKRTLSSRVSRRRRLRLHFMPHGKRARRILGFYLPPKTETRHFDTMWCAACVRVSGISYSNHLWSPQLCVYESGDDDDGVYQLLRRGPLGKTRKKTTDGWWLRAGSKSAPSSCSLCNMRLCLCMRVWVHYFRSTQMQPAWEKGIWLF